MRLVCELMAEKGESVDESVMLVDRETGDEREVDVVIRGSIAGMPMRIGIETTARKKPADVKWVEAEVHKHQAVGTDKLILVSESGFTKRARTKALAKGAVPVQPEDFTSEDRIGEVVNRLGSVWPKEVALTPTKLVGWVLDHNGNTAQASDLDLTTLIVTEHGEELATISDEIRRRFDANFPAICDQIGLAEIAGDVEANFILGMPDWIGTRNSEQFHACLGWQPEESEPPQFHRLVEIKVAGRAAISVAEIELTHKKLGEFMVAYGEGAIGNSDAVVVFTEDENGGKGALQIGRQSPGKASRSG
jgi:hypothetical protein